MVRPDLGNRARYLLVAVVVGQVLLISAQIGTNAGPSLLRTAVVSLVTRLQEGSWFVVGGVRSVIDSYAGLRGAHAENARLAREMTDLRAELQEARAKASGADEMRALLEMRPRLPWTTTGAAVVGGSISPDFRSMTIDKGLSEGVGRDMPVIARDGVVGRVALAAGHTATVQFIVDRSAAAAGRIERSTTDAIAMGNGDGTLRLEYLAATADVQPDDLVVTAGIDGIYPPGLALGRVEQVERNGAALKRVTIRAAVDFSRLGSVLVILSPRPVAAPAAPAAGVTGGEVKTTLRVAAFVVAAALLQSALAKVAGGAVFDLVLVAVVAVALRHGRVAGLVSGTLAGLVQDALGGGVLGLSGLGKSIAGYLTGVVATQFIVNEAAPRGLIFAGATLVNAACFIGLSMLLGIRHYDHPFLDALIQAVVNALLGVLLFAALEFAPSARAWGGAVLERRRKRRYHA